MFDVWVCIGKMVFFIMYDVEEVLFFVMCFVVMMLGFGCIVEIFELLFVWCYVELCDVCVVKLLLDFIVWCEWLIVYLYCDEVVVEFV